MRPRWMSILILAAALFAINLVARLVIRFGFQEDSTAQNVASIAMFAVIGLVLAVLTFRRSQHESVNDWVPGIAGGALLAMLLTVIVGPFVSGDNPFTNSGDNIFSQLGLYFVFALLGTLIGFWTAIMLGRDHRTRGLRAYQTAKSRQRRIVRR